MLKKLRDKGIWGVIVAVLWRVPGVRAVAIYNIYSLDCAQHVPKQSSNGTRIVRIADAKELPDLRAMQDNEALFRRRLEMGHIGFFAYAGGDLVGYIWAQQGNVHEEQRFGFSVPFEVNEVFTYDSFVNPQYRGQGVWRSMIDAVVDWAAVNGAKKIVAMVDLHNRHSVSIHNRLNYRKGRLGMYFEIFGLRWVR